MEGKYYIGCSGWWYKDWDERFYPKGISEGSRLKYYARFFNTTEANVTFYRLPSRRVVDGWARRTPRGFIFSVKAPQDITHAARLVYAERKMAKFFDLLEPLKRSGKLGAILFQLPPEFTKTKAFMDRLENFLGMLPSGYEYAVEFRHRSWIEESTFRLLERYNVAYVIVDEPLLPPDIYITADYAYIRLHGRGKRVWYYYNYNKEELVRWAEKVKVHVEPEVKRLYIYFNNHFRAYAPKNAREFIQLLGLTRLDLGLEPVQQSLMEF